MKRSEQLNQKMATGIVSMPSGYNGLRPYDQLFSSGSGFAAKSSVNHRQTTDTDQLNKVKGMINPLKGERQPAGEILSDDHSTRKDSEMVGEFDHSGGELCKPGSDVRLSIPPDAIPQGEVRSIRGKVYMHDRSRFVPLFQLKEDERFISPVVELTADNLSTRFERYLLLKIPIVDCFTFRVLSVSDELSTVKPVPLVNSIPSNPPDMYYQLEDDGFVHVYTKHFTLFACTGCKANHLSLECIIFGRWQPAPHGWEVNLKLYICDQIDSVTNFKESLEKEEIGMGSKKLDKTFFQLNKPDTGDEIEAAVTMTERAWTPILRPDGSPVFSPKQKVKIWDLVYCKDLHLLEAGEWKFTSNDESVPFECNLDVKQVPSVEKVSGGFTTINIRLRPEAFSMQKTQGHRELEITQFTETTSSYNVLAIAEKPEFPEPTLDQQKIDYPGGRTDAEFDEKSPGATGRVDLAQELETGTGTQESSKRIGKKRRSTGPPEQQSTPAETSGKAALIQAESGEANTSQFESVQPPGEKKKKIISDAL